MTTMVFDYGWLLRLQRWTYVLFPSGVVQAIYIDDVWKAPQSGLTAKFSFLFCIFFKSCLNLFSLLVYTRRLMWVKKAGHRSGHDILFYVCHVSRNLNGNNISTCRVTTLRKKEVLVMENKPVDYD